MGGVRLTPDQVRDTRAALLRHSGNLNRVAIELGIARSTVQSRVAALASGRYPDKQGETVLSSDDDISPCPASCYSPAITAKPRYRGVPWSWQKHDLGSTEVISDDPIRVCVIGDLHVAPGQDLSRLRWIARHIGETEPDHIVQIGDWASFDSVSNHDPIGSIKAKYKPSLRQDIECLHESLSLFDRELGPSLTPRTVTLGNHEDRVRKYEELRGELEGSLWIEVLQSFAQHRWKTAEFGRVVFLGGVGFVHVPLNGMGKAHSSPNIIGHNLAHDLIRGHSHKAMYSSFPKIGEDVGFTLIDVGTSLPHGHVEPYAKLTQTGWYWGIHDVIIRDGRIDDFARVSMRSLEARYA